jgi:hypothetical protein
VTGCPVPLLRQMVAAMAGTQPGDVDSDAFEGAPAGEFEAELALEGVTDRFDEPADRLEQWLTAPGGLVLAAEPPQQRDAPDLGNLTCIIT